MTEVVWQGEARRQEWCQASTCATGLMVPLTAGEPRRKSRFGAKRILTVWFVEFEVST